MYLGVYENRVHQGVSAIVDCKLENESDLSMFFLSPWHLEGIRRAYPINCGVCSWYTAINESLFDRLQSYENIGRHRKHVTVPQG